MLTYLGTEGKGPNLSAHVQAHGKNIRLILHPNGSLAFGFEKLPFGTPEPVVKTLVEFQRRERFIQGVYNAVRPRILSLLAAGRKSYRPHPKNGPIYFREAAVLT